MSILLTLGQSAPPEVSITGTTTLTAAALSANLSSLKWHVCSGTTSDYTVTLPATSGYAGFYLAIRMDEGLTKLVTLDANSTEEIDGSTTRIMWAGESAILYCDGSNWFKVAGKSIPMTCSITRESTDQTGMSTGVTSMVADTHDTGTALMWDSANGLIKIVRPGQYDVTTFTYVVATSGTMTYSAHGVDINGAQGLYGYGFSSVVSAGTISAGMGMTSVGLAVNDYVTAFIQHDATTAKLLAAAFNRCTVTEKCLW